MEINNFTNSFDKNELNEKIYDNNVKKDINASFLRSSDRQLPLAVVSKIMKRPIPSVAKLSKDSKELMQKVSSEFIAIITCRAKEMCNSEARKTITGEDLIKAMEDLDMPYYSEYTKKIFEKYKESLKATRSLNEENVSFMN